MTKPSPKMLLSVSTDIPCGLLAQIAADNRPTPDYRALQLGLPADLVSYQDLQASGSPMARIVHRISGPDAALGVLCFHQRHDYDIVITDNERVGFVLATLFRVLRRRDRPAHAMVTHVMTRRKKRIVHRLLGLQQTIDRYLVYSTNQQRYLIDRLVVEPTKVRHVPFTVDHDFFRHRRGHEPPSDRPLVVSAGLEHRDYSTLFEAVAPLDIDVIVAADTAHGSSGRASVPSDPPHNVDIVVSQNHVELRRLYSRAAVVVVPLLENPFQAGVTTILEAMAVGCPVVVTRTAGQRDVITDGIDGRYVSPEDAVGLRKVLQSLLDAPDDARALGDRARITIENTNTLKRYVAAIQEAADPTR